MDNNFSLSDIVAALGGAGGMGCNSFIWVLLILIFFGGAWNRNGGDYGQYATAASQQEILFNQHFNNLDNKMDRGFTSIGNGISDATYALNNTIINESRRTQEAVGQNRFDMATYRGEILAAIGADGAKTRDLIRDNEMQRVRDERDYYRGMWGQRNESDRILGVQGRYYNNPPCRECCCNN